MHVAQLKLRFLAHKPSRCFETSERPAPEEAESRRHRKSGLDILLEQMPKGIS
jgi:hypothetical protein